MKYQSTNLTYNNISEPGIATTGLVYRGDKDYNNPNKYGSNFLVNCIDINWGQVEMSNGQTITSSGDLLNIINTMAAFIDIILSVKPEPEKKYYYLASFIGVNKQLELLGQTDIFNNITSNDILKDVDLHDNFINIEYLKNNLDQVKNIIDSSINDSWPNDNRKFDLADAIKFYPIIIAPESWINTLDMDNILLNSMNNPIDKEIIEFYYDEDKYVLIFTIIALNQGELKIFN